MVFLRSPRAQIQYIRSKNVTLHDANNWFSINKQTVNNTANGQSKTRSYELRIVSLRSWRFCLASAQMSANERWSYESSRGLQAARPQGKKSHCYCCSRWFRLVLLAASTLSPTKQLGSISAVSRVRSLILPKERLFRGMSAGSFSRTAAGNRAYKTTSYQIVSPRRINLCGGYRVTTSSCNTQKWQEPNFSHQYHHYNKRIVHEDPGNDQRAQKVSIVKQVPHISIKCSRAEQFGESVYWY